MLSFLEWGEPPCSGKPLGKGTAFAWICTLLLIVSIYKRVALPITAKQGDGEGYLVWCGGSLAEDFSSEAIVEAEAQELVVLEMLIPAWCRTHGIVVAEVEIEARGEKARQCHIQRVLPLGFDLLI